MFFFLLIFAFYPIIFMSGVWWLDGAYGKVIFPNFTQRFSSNQYPLVLEYKVGERGEGFGSRNY